MGMDAEKDIQFITMPNQDARYPRVSMVLPVVDELLAALNSGFDPMWIRSGPAISRSGPKQRWQLLRHWRDSAG